LGFEVQGLGLEVWGLGFPDSRFGVGSLDELSVLRVSCFEVQVQGFTGKG